MPVGLCENCKNVEIIANRRGSRFYLCTLAAHDARFSKYPRLPVLSCEGYEARVEEKASADQDSAKKSKCL